jgi:hypothetical protein
VRHVAKQEVTVIDGTKETETTVRFLFKVRQRRSDGRIYEITAVGCEDSSTTKGATPEKDTFKGFRGYMIRVKVGAANRGLEPKPSWR